MVEAMKTDLQRAAGALLDTLWQLAFSGARSHEENWTEMDRRWPQSRWVQEALKSTDPSGWQPMETAPLDGKHCILSVQEGAFIVSVQGFYHRGKWIAVHRDDVQPLAWMPNILLPDDLCPPSFRTTASTAQGGPRR